MADLTWFDLSAWRRVNQSPMLTCACHSNGSYYGGSRVDGPAYQSGETDGIMESLQCCAAPPVLPASIMLCRAVICRGTTA